MMRLMSFFALRYMFTGSRLGAVGWITLISAVAIGVVSMAMVLVLSVYNGYVQMIEISTDISTPELIITPREGATLDLASDAALAAVLGDSTVRSYALVLEGVGVLHGASGEQLVEVLGVEDAYWDIVPSDSLILEGDMPRGVGGELKEIEPITLGLGLLSPTDGAMGQTYTLFFPRRQGVINPLLPSTAFRTYEVGLAAVLRPVSEELDRKAYVRLQLMQELLGYEAQQASYIAIKGRGSVEALRSRLASLLPEHYIIKDRAEQHPELTLLIKVEKFMVYAIMLFILLLATFSLISGLAMLIMEKRADLSMLTALGMRHGQQRSVFTLVGLMVSLSGAGLGLLLGFLLCFVQQTWTPLTAGSGAMEMPFPVLMKWSDFLLILVGILSMSVVTSMFLSLFMRRQVRP